MRPTLGSLGVALVTASLLSGGPAAGHEPAPKPASPLTTRPALPAIRPAPDFTLTDTTGRAVRLSTLRGRIVVVSFIYTQCPAACPLLTRRLALLEARLGAAGRGEAVTLLSVTVDAERDSAEALAGYARRFGANLAHWHFLRDDGARLAPVLATWDEWTRRLPNGEIDHPARVYLVDARGMVREIYSLEFFDERQAWLDISALLGERH